MAKHFYSKMIPDLEHLIRQGKSSGDPAKVSAADALARKLEEVLGSSNHRWYLNKMDPQEQQERERRQREFQQRYK